jgi:hypothetical protein
MKSKFFYSEADINEMEKALTSSNDTVKAISFILADHPNFSDRARSSIEQKLLKVSKTVSRPQKEKKVKPAPKRTISFYSKDEVKEMVDALTTSNTSMRKLSKMFSIKYGRNEVAVMAKIFNLSKNIVRPVKESKNARYINKNKVQSSAKITVEKITVPQTLGIDVPEGTSFDIQNVKRVVLQKKSLTIYF